MTGALFSFLGHAASVISPWYHVGMDFAPVYLVQRLLYRAVDFFHHWYVDGSRAIAHKFINTLETADQSFAVKITLRHFFEPLYGDYSPVGRVVGTIFRTGRVIIGGVFYLLITIFFALVYLVWIFIPAVILLYVVMRTS